LWFCPRQPQSMILLPMVSHVSGTTCSCYLNSFFIETGSQYLLAWASLKL
jgi:hypothetical protein